MSEKQQIMIEPLAHYKRVSSRRRIAVWLLAVLLGAAYLAVSHVVTQSWRHRGGVSPPLSSHSEAVCVQPAALFPAEDKKLSEAYEHLASDDFRSKTIARLSGAVQIRTETFDDLGEVGEDRRWDVFFGFYDYLERTFPAVHQTLRVEKINTHGLLYTWQGSAGDDDAAHRKPAVLMAHQDTVPVPDDTIDAWTYPPWSGAYDGKFIWGRGSSDCKNQLIAVLEATELLVQHGFQPKRTLLLAFGFDEETFGYHGAGNISAVLHDRYGDDGLALVIDEGAGFERAWGTLFAKPGVAEKGSTNVEVTVRSPGGHSSIPRDHTSIGILSELITQVEATQYPARLDERNPYFAQLQCGAAHAAAFPPKLRTLLKHHRPSNSLDEPDRLAIEAAKQGPEIRYLLQTSQVVDIVAGGVKVNAMPERAKAVINHRVNIGETTQVVYDRLTRIAGGVAAKYNLSLHAFDGQDDADSIVLVAPQGSESSPISPADGTGVNPFSALAGSVRAIYGEETIVTPGIMTGNTDTRFFWNLTKHLFRFAPGYDPEDLVGALRGVHTIDEKINVNNHINAVRFFFLFVRNIDSAEV
ncbi:hypothetical protein HMPREF1624_01690 [Sporothrix schenckii ATCC 58251]|uniref:Peptidase M20 dimerisation domain-containing protein n=1 Tax=Sporothrix schenckii (strain ATCC 58251 / de Perez 2211183) TaxID=1391915 RepID=U7Q9F7_SPOS1|nr:hypothetical protein HMPREF1624_01690 [Sporothrix schenckii ATCC 58251]